MRFEFQKRFEFVIDFFVFIQQYSIMGLEQLFYY